MAGSFAYSPVAGTLLPAGAQTLTATFTPTNATDYTTATASVTLIVTAPSGLLGVSPYTVVNINSGDCIDDTNGATANGTLVKQQPCTAGDRSQEWVFTSVGSGYYEVASANLGSAAWNVTGNSKTAGTGIQLWGYCCNAANMQFEPVVASNGNYQGVYKFIDRNSGLCLNLPNTTAGQQMQINTCNSATSELFKLTPVNGVSSTPYPITGNTSYTVVDAASGDCIDDTNGATANGTLVKQQPCTAGDRSQQWLFTASGVNIWEVSTANQSGQAWNVSGLGTTPGTGIQIWSYCCNQFNERFAAFQLSPGYAEFVDENSGLCLNLPNSTAGQQMQLNTCNGSSSESFQLTAVK